MSEAGITLADFALLQNLCSTPGISGREVCIARLFQAELDNTWHNVETRPHNIVIGHRGPADAKRRIFVVAHLDELGLIVTHVTDDGFLKFGMAGTPHPAGLVGTEVTIWPRGNAEVPGVIGSMAVHHIDKDKRGSVPQLKDLSIDVGASSSEEVMALGIETGDSVTYNANYTRLAGTRVYTKAADNRFGVAALLWTAKALLQHPIPTCHVCIVGTPQEELGLRGAKILANILGITDTDVCIGIDVALATDYPCAKDYKWCHGDVSLGGGPVIYRGTIINEGLVTTMTSSSEELEIPFQYAPVLKDLGTDASAIQIHGAPTAHVGVPLRYMHSHTEVGDVRDIVRAAAVIANTISRITPETSF